MNKNFLAGNRTRITGTTILHDNHYTISEFNFILKDELKCLIKNTYINP